MLLSLFVVVDFLLRVLRIVIIQAILSWLVAFNVINTHNDFVRSFLYALDRFIGDGRVYVSTSAGDFFAGRHQNSDDERVFTYDKDGKLVGTTVIDTATNSDMGLFGLALDGNTGPNHKLYVADMNGRILRLGPGRAPGRARGLLPGPGRHGLAGDWMKSMWNDLVFDKAGNLYVPDDKPRIWRVAPDGTASIWFTDPRLTGFFGFAGGPLGGRIDPTGTVAVRLDHGVGRVPARVVDLSRPAGRPSDGRGPRARPPVPVRPDRGRAAAGDRPRVRRSRATCTSA